MAYGDRGSTTRWVVVFGLATAVSLLFNVQLPGSSPLVPRPTASGPSLSPSAPATSAPSGTKSGATKPAGSASPTTTSGERSRALLPTSRPAGKDAAWWDESQRPETAQRVFGTLMPAKTSCAPLQYNDQKELLSATRSFVSCVHRSMAPVLKHAHYDVTVPKIVLCAKVTDEDGCSDEDASASMSTDNTMRVYWEAFTMMTSRQATIVILHEYTHALQFWFGIDEDPRLQEPDDQRFSRRMELQALCGSVILTERVTTHPFTASDTRFSAESGGPDHWNATSARYWIKKGMAAKNFGACDTMQAAGRLVGG